MFVVFRHYSLAWETIFQRRKKKDDLLFSVPSARFIGGRSPREGLVQVYYNKTWSWVCVHQWDRKDADVACRMMGFDGSLSAAFENDNFKGPEIPVLVNNMRCTGNESSLFVCAHDGLGHHDCKIKRKAGVVCRAKGKYLQISFGGALVWIWPKFEAKKRNADLVCKLKHNRTFRWCIEIARTNQITPIRYNRTRTVRFYLPNARR